VPYEHLVTRFPAVMGSTAAMAAPGDALAAEIRYRTTTGNLYWRGHVDRIDTGLSATSRSVRVYVQVDLAPEEPPPAANLYVEVQLAGPELEDLVLIPRLAWHEGTVLIAGSDNRLERRAVTVAFAAGERLALAGGVDDGERIILTDLLFPAEGMAISPIVVDETAAL
jgi:multidrug efflux pump subunit AcrA (membrane-fusion protein)